MTINTTKLAAILTVALSLAAPLTLGATAADARTMYGNGMQGGYRANVIATPVAYHDNGGNFGGGNYGFSDRNHRPAPRAEMRMPMPHQGYRWHAGNWNWQRGHWAWAGGFYSAR
jgi:hypothetical protein